VYFDFVPLKMMSEKDAAEVENLKAQTDGLLIESGAIGPEDSRRRIASDEDSDYHGIDPDDLPEIEPPEEDLNIGAPPAVPKLKEAA
jgi:hypothetical protein